MIVIRNTLIILIMTAMLFAIVAVVVTCRMKATIMTKKSITFQYFWKNYSAPKVANLKSTSTMYK